MKNTVTTVTEYLAAVPDDRRDALVRLRNLCLDSLKGYTETIQYGMPSYSLNGESVVSFASQKQHIAVYVCRPAVVDTFRAELGALNVGKGCIRFRKTEQMDFSLLEKILRSVEKS
jgi:uncharacterized protein YdhG (YjbR/CyaY superfamily)